MKSTYLLIAWSFICVFVALFFLLLKMHDFAAFWGLLAIVSSIYGSVNYAVKMYLDLKHIDIKNDLKKK